MVPQQQRRRRRRVVAPRTTERRVIVVRGPGGFGFTIAGQRPCVVSAVAADGPADRAGLRAGDALIAVDGASVSRAPHAAVARLVAGAPGPIALAVALRGPLPTDTEDTEPDERARIRRRHPPPRRRPHPSGLNHPGCVGPSTSTMSDILQSLSRGQLSPVHAGQLECRAVLQYLGTIETPEASQVHAPGSVRAAVKKLRQERRTAAPVLLGVLPAALQLRTPDAQLLASYPRQRIVYVGTGSEADRRYFGLVTAAEGADAHSCHVFGVEARLSDHAAHAERAHEFRISCTRDPVTERCLEFPPSAEYVVGVIRGMYSLPPDEYHSPTLHQISKLVNGDSPSLGNFNRCSRQLRPHRAYRDHEEVHGFISESPQPSEVTTTSSNSDSGIGFHNDGRNISDKILVVDFNHQPPLQRFRPELRRRPLGIIGCDSSSFLSNPTPVVDGFGGLELPLESDVSQPLRSVNDDSYNYNNTYANLPCVRSEEEGEDGTKVTAHLYDMIPSEADVDEVASSLSGVEIGDTASMCSEGSRPRHPLQASLDDMLLSMRAHAEGTSTDPPAGHKPTTDDHVFLHPATLKTKVRKSKPLGMVWKTRSLLGRRRCARSPPQSAPLPAAASEPNLRDSLSEQSSPFRRWTTSNGTGADYSSNQADRIVYGKSAAAASRRRSTADSDPAICDRDLRSLCSKQLKIQNMSEGSKDEDTAEETEKCYDKSSPDDWRISLKGLLHDPYGVNAFATFLMKEFAIENLKFLLACKAYAEAQDEGSRRALAAQIWEAHLADEAPEPVNLDADSRNATQALLMVNPPPDDLFEQAYNHVYNMVQFDTYQRFLKSQIYKDCLEAAKQEKLKKSTSNASETRRSGGGGMSSFFPWRRGQSRDRAIPSSSTASSANDSCSPAYVPDDEAVAGSSEIVNQAVAQAIGLCRVVLPDGATSVVGVFRNQRVRDVIERILRRRHLRLTAYEVVTSDYPPRTIINLLTSAVVLVGREVTTEERAVVRFEISGHGVGVWCAGGQRLRGVLARLMRLQPPPSPGIRVVVVAANNHWLHPDSIMRDLHAQSLSVEQVAGRADRSGRQRRASLSLSDDSRYRSPEGYPDDRNILVVTDERQLNTDPRFEAIRRTPEPGQSAFADTRHRITKKIQRLAIAGHEVSAIALATARLGVAMSVIETEPPSVSTTPAAPPTTPVASGSHAASSGPSTSAGPSASAGPSTSAGPSASAGPAPSLVRAAMQPGVHLHNNPHEFLNNLRATRSAILDGKLSHKRENTPPPPPPLPPKPARHPTIV